MLFSLIKKITRDAEKSEPLFKRLREEGQDGEVDDGWCPQYKHSQQNSQRHPKLWNAACFVLGTLMGITGLLVGQETTSRSVDVELIESPNPVIPQVPMVKTTFERQELFAAPPSDEADRAWSSLMPYGDGFINVNNSQALGLPPGIRSPEGELYDVSMFHQLHCLILIRKTLFITKFALNHTNAEKIDEKLIKPSMMHVYHCFDYIRQALMCAGDLTLEWPRTEENGRRFAVDGWGISHQCKSWEAISDYMTLNRKQP